MAYIGKQPTVGNFVVLDAITTSATTTFALKLGGVAYYPATANNCIVSLNGIIQAPISSFTISGSNIVFSSALTSTDVIDFIQVLGDVLNIGTPSDNTVSLAKLTATGTKDSTTFLRGDNTFQTIGANTPAFFAYQGSAQTYSTTATKIQLNTESFDTNSNFDTSTYRFTPTTSGKYFIYAQIFITSPGTNSFFNTFIYKNGGNEVWQGTKTTSINADFSIEISAIISMNGSTDYIELYGYNNTSKTTIAGSQFTYMTGFKLIE